MHSPGDAGQGEGQVRQIQAAHHRGSQGSLPGWGQTSPSMRGDRVGVGCMVNSCRECANCLKGEEQYCLNGMTGTYGAEDRDGTITQGGYSTHVVVTEDFVLRIPEGLTSTPPPRCCAPVSPLSPRCATGAQGPARRLPSSAWADWVTWQSGSRVQLLTLHGALVNVGAPAEPLPVNAFALITGRRSFAGSMIGGIRETQEMLDFCAQHGIGAEIEVIPAEKNNDAYERVLASDVRYRFVIDTATLS